MIIGLTGNIASGKSTVRKILGELGCCIIDADKIGKDIVEPNTKANSQLIKAFGKEYFNSFNELNRKKLGEFVFANPSQLKVLNEITHPEIIKEIQRQIHKSQRDNPNVVIVIEAAILIEAKMDFLVDSIWIVVADDEIRLKRGMARDNTSAEVIKCRMANQMSQEAKIKLSDIVIQNNGDEVELRESTQGIWANFVKENSLKTS